jgi:hypothetical protein
LYTAVLVEKCTVVCHLGVLCTASHFCSSGAT